MDGALITFPVYDTICPMNKQGPVYRLLQETEAMLEGHFLLSSGRHSDRYFQCARLLQYPEKAAMALEPVVEAVRAAVRAGKIAVDAVVGPAMGGVVVAYELGRQLGVPAFFTERDDAGAMTLRRGFTIEPGQNIMIAEDVVTTGKSTAETAAVIEAMGGTVTALVCVVDRRAKDTPPLPWQVFPAIALEAANWDAADCVLCKSGAPLVKHGSRKKF
jgi:orotate phosphoribosyltransferase